MYQLLISFFINGIVGKVEEEFMRSQVHERIDLFDSISNLRQKEKVIFL